jgi:hypothetical protein
VSVLEFVSALVSSIAWPAVAIVLGLVFRKQFKVLLAELAKRFGRLTKLKGGSFEAQFEDLKELEAQTVLSSRIGGNVTQTSGVGGSVLIGREAQPDEKVSGQADLQIEVKTDAEGHVERATEPEGGESQYVQLDPQVRSLLIEAKTVVDRKPREAVLLAGRALEQSIRRTADSLGISYGADAKGPNTYVPPIFALRHAKVVGDLEAEMLDQLYRLYRSAARDTAEEITGLSALQYILRVEREIGSLAVKTDAKLNRPLGPPK